MTNTFERLSALLTKEFKLQPEQLTPDAPLAGLGIDSLGTVEMLWNIEETFHIKLPADPVDLATVGDVVRYVDELMARQSVGPVPSAAVQAALRAT
jgi:acyl carrier protein